MKRITCLAFLIPFCLLTMTPLPSQVAAQQPLSIHLSEQPRLVAPIQDPHVRIVPASSRVVPDEVFTVAVRVERAQNLGGYRFKIDYDPAVVQVQAVEDAGFLGSTGRVVVPVGPTIVPGTVSFGAYTTGDAPPPDGSGQLALITLKAIGAIGETSPLHLYDVRLQDIGGALQPIDDLSDGTVRVVPVDEKVRIFVPIIMRGYTLLNHGTSG